MVPAFIYAAFLRVLAFISPVYATGDTPVEKITLFNPLGDSMTDFNAFLNALLTGLTALAIPVVAIIVMVGAYNIITSGGNAAKLKKGKDYILYAAIGFAVLLLATSVSAIVTSFISAPTS